MGPDSGVFAGHAARRADNDCTDRLQVGGPAVQVERARVGSPDATTGRTMKWMGLLVCLAFLSPGATAGAERGRPPGREAPGVLRQLNTALAQLADRVSPAVVQSVVSGYGPVSSDEGQAAAA